MRTWKELGEEFRNLIPSMPHTFLDAQWGSAGEYWNVGGRLSAEARTRFNILSILAGEKLLDLPFPQDYLEVLQRDEPSIRWFRVLRDLSGAFEHHPPAGRVDDDGNLLATYTIYSGRINDLPEVASNVCLKCELLESSAPQRGIPEELVRVGLNAAADHWRKSQEHRQARPPDMVSAASEAIKSLEGVAKEIAGLPTGTLGDCIKKLRNKRKLSPGTAECLEGLWTFTNATDGIRHGAGQEFVFQGPEVEFLLDSCASAIRLLLTIDAA